MSELSQIDVFAFSRASIWKSALAMMGDYPLFGVGLGQFQFFSQRYAFPVEHHWALYSRVAGNPHSEYLRVGAELGVPGMMIFVSCVGFLFWIAVSYLKRQPPEERGKTAPLLGALAALFAQAAVDFPFRAPLIAMTTVLLMARLRFHGVEGPSWLLEFRVRKVYSVAAAVLALFLIAAAVRPVLGFWYFLGGIGAPQDIRRDKWAVDEAPRREVPLDESIGWFERAMAVDPRNSIYHSALGSRYFQSVLKGGGEEELLKRGLFHANYAAELNPNNQNYLINLGQAMEELYRRIGRPAFLDETEKHFLQAARLAPRYYPLQEKLAFLHVERGRMEKAEGYFRRVLELEPNYLGGWYSLAMYLRGRGEIKAARAALLRGLLSSRLKLKERAVTSYERKLVDFDPAIFENELVRNWSNMLSPKTKNDTPAQQVIRKSKLCLPCRYPDLFFGISGRRAGAFRGALPLEAHREPPLSSKGGAVENNVPGTQDTSCRRPLGEGDRLLRRASYDRPASIRGSTTSWTR